MRDAPPAVRPLDIISSTLVAFNVALAQPLLDLLGRKAGFFVARDTPRLDLVLFAILVALVVPLLLSALVLVLRAVSHRLGASAHFVVLASLVAGIVLLVLKRLDAGSGVAAVVVSAAVGAGISVVFYRSSALRAIVRFGSFVPLLVIGLFLLVSPASKLVFPDSAPVSEIGAIGNEVPVIMIVFDEFPVASLMDRSGAIDEDLFPNFARLGESSIWFRNATTVHPFSTDAVPALLDGRFPQPDSLPTTGDHPQNLFTVLSPSYDLDVTEPLTQLCPASACPTDDAGSFATRWTSLLADVGIVAAHIVTPNDLATALPPIGDAWGGFANAGRSGLEDPLERIRRLRRGSGAFAGTFDARDVFADFVDALEGDDGARFYFLHSLLPHQPWRYLPSGQEYPQTEPIPGTEGDEWGNDTWLIAQAYQRHLLQVGAVDGLVGDLLDALEAEDLFDRSLVIVTADHGIAFRPGRPRRAVTPRTIGDIAAVPLFVKRPFQKRGRISDRPVEGIDVFPTVAEVLGIEGLMPVDGVSVFSDESSPRTEKQILMRGDRFSFPVLGREKMRVVRMKYRTFPVTIDGSLDLFGVAPGVGGLIGRSADRVADENPAEVVVEVSDLDLFERARPKEDPFPALLSGRVIRGPTEHPVVLAIAVNGNIVAVTRSRAEDDHDFYAILPPSAFGAEINEVDIFEVEPGTDEHILHPVDISG